MTLVKALWIAVGVIWAANLVLSRISRRKAKKAAEEAQRVTVVEESDAAADEAACSAC